MRAFYLIRRPDGSLFVTDKLKQEYRGALRRAVTYCWVDAKRLLGFPLSLYQQLLLDTKQDEYLSSQEYKDNEAATN